MAQGHQLFTDELTRLTAETADPRLDAITASITAPLRVGVGGRRGVGRRSVAEALDATGVSVVDTAADATVYVVAEAVKPEDAAAVQEARRRPVLMVLNKADLPGRCSVAQVAGATRTPAESMSALFALAAGDGRPEGRLDDRLWAALEQLAAQPADVGSAERFVSCPHPVPRQTRERLCAVLDLSGIERAVGLARRGGTLRQARTVLRGLSGVDRVVARLTEVSAAVYHRRMTAAVARLEALAVADPHGAIDEFLIADATVAARMAAAVAAVQEHQAAGETGLRRARRWQAYRGAPLDATGRACAADIARGSLRAWSATRGLR